MTEPSAVEIHAGEPERPYEVLGEVKAEARAMTILHPKPKPEKGEAKLREKAAEMGADAVINVAMDRNVSSTSWKALKMTGTAVRYSDAAGTTSASG